MRHVSLIALCSLLASPSPVWAEAKPSMTLAFSAAPAVAGSAGNTLTFSFTATERTDGQVVILVPAPVSGDPWSAPQTTNSSGAGFVGVQSAGCGTASVASITGDASGSWSIAVDYKCSQKKSFVVTYRATAATRVGVYEFTTIMKYGKNVLPVAVQPVVTVLPGAAAALDLAGLANAPAGTAQTAVVTALDAYGNVAVNYLGPVAFITGDPQASVPPTYIFTPADAGSASFAGGVVLKTQGPQTVRVWDGTLMDSETTVVSPGPTAQLQVTVTGDAIAFKRYLAPNCSATPYDAYGNFTPGYTGSVQWSSSDAHAQLPVTGLWGQLNFNICTFYTEGSQDLTVTDTANAALTGTVAVSVQGPAAFADTITVLNPTHPARITTPTLNPLVNDRFGDLALPTIASIKQVTYTTESGATRQLGIASVSEDGQQVIWDLYPPADATAEDPGMELERCAPPDASGGVCSFAVPFEMEYVATDGVNDKPATISLTIALPDSRTFSVPPPPVPPYAGPLGFVPKDKPGFLIPENVPLTVTNVTVAPPTELTVARIDVRGSLCPDPPPCTPLNFTTSITVALPDGFASSGTVQGITLRQGQSLILSPLAEPVSLPSVQVGTAPTPGAFSLLWNMGGLIDIAGTGTTTALHVPVPAPQTLITVPNLSGRDLKTVATDIARLGLIASSCSGTPPSGTVTGQSPGAGTNVLAGSVVKYFYNGCAPF